MYDEVQRGEIWMHEFAAPDKRRPVLILTRSEAIRHLDRVVTAPLTTTIRGGPSQVVLGVDLGLKGPSAVNLHNLTLVPRDRLRRYIGTVPPDIMEAVCRALCYAMACGPLA